MVKLESVFEPDLTRHERYQARFQLYKQLGPRMTDYLQELANDTHQN